MTDQIHVRLQSVLEGFIHDGDELAAVLRGDDIMDAVSIDSMAFLDLVVRLESEFGLSFGYEDIEMAFTNIDTLTAHLTANATT